MNTFHTFKTLQLFFLYIFWSFSCFKKTYFMDNLEEKLLTIGSYPLSCQENLDNLEVPH
jgi:hypothetical protein